MYLPLIILQPQLYFSQLSRYALKCLHGRYTKTSICEKFHRQYSNNIDEAIFLDLTHASADAIFSEYKIKNPNRPFPYSDCKYQHYQIGNAVDTREALESCQAISICCDNINMLRYLFLNYRDCCLTAVELVDMTGLFHEYYGHFQKLEILDFGLILDLNSQDILTVFEANPRIRVLTLYQMTTDPNVTQHPVMQQLETLTLRHFNTSSSHQDVLIKYFQTTNISTLIIDHYVDFFKQALQAPNLSSLQISVVTLGINPFIDQHICRLSQIISLSLIFRHKQSEYEFIYAAISNLPLLQRFESNADITIKDKAFVEIITNAAKLDFFCVPNINFSDEVLLMLKGKFAKMTGLGFCLDTNSEIAKRAFCQSCQNLLYYIYSTRNGDEIKDCISSINTLIFRNTLKIRQQAGLKHLAAKKYATHYANIPKLVPEVVQDLIRFYLQDVDFDDTWNWLSIHNLC